MDRQDAKKRHLELAKRVIRDGQSFRKAAVSVGYSANSADMGPDRMRKQSPGLDKAFRTVALQVEHTPDALKKYALHRIVKTCTDDKNSDNLRAAELIGRMKAVDLFVRPGDVQVGIFAQIVGENKELDTIDLPALPESGFARSASDANSDSSTAIDTPKLLADPADKKE